MGIIAQIILKLVLCLLNPMLSDCVTKYANSYIHVHIIVYEMDKQANHNA